MLKIKKLKYVEWNKLMEIKKLLKLLKQSVELLYENDKYLILHSVHEQDISYRIAHYFENLLNNYDWYSALKLNVDVEYNRNIDNIKETNGIKCKPDIILHARGNNENNIIVIEIKKEQNTCDDDFRKLSDFTHSALEYKYSLGIYINIERNNSTYKYFKNGHEITENEL